MAGEKIMDENERKGEWVPIEGHSPPLDPVTQANGTTWVKKHNPLIEDPIKPLDRAMPRRRKKTPEQIHEEVLSDRLLIQDIMNLPIRAVGPSWYGKGARWLVAPE
jgi:hypothetical protein